MESRNERRRERLIAEALADGDEASNNPDDLGEGGGVTISVGF